MFISNSDFKSQAPPVSVFKVGFSFLLSEAEIILVFLQESGNPDFIKAFVMAK